jgi:hypothetical protein
MESLVGEKLTADAMPFPDKLTSTGNANAEILRLPVPSYPSQ